MTDANKPNTGRTLCSCGDLVDGINARHGRPNCRQCARLIADGGNDLTDETVANTPDVGIRHDLNELPEDFEQLSQGSQRAIAGGFSRPDVIRLIRQRIGSQITTKTDRLAKPELVDLLIMLIVGDRQ